MSKRISKPLVAVSLLLLAACATQKAAEKGEVKKEAQPEKIALSNVSPFDVAACGMRELELPAITQESVIGALLAAQPSFQECLVDSKTRGAANETRVTVKATLDADVKYEVSGDNLEAGGKACIEAAAKKLPLTPRDKGSAAVIGQFGFAHAAGPSPSVKFGVNLASDVVGTIRLAQPSWCDCYADVGVNPPPSIKAHLRLLPPAAKDAKDAKDAKPDAPQVQSTEVRMEAGAEVLAAKVSACLEGKLKALALPTVATELQVPYPFLLINSWAPAESPDAPPAFQFLQLESIRGQRNADVAIALGGRGQSAAAYDAVVTKYKAKPAPLLIKELKDKCATVLKADERWVAALKALLDTDQRVLTLVSALKARDPQWVPVEAEANKRVSQVNGDIATALKQKAVDANACPKDRK